MAKPKTVDEQIESLARVRAGEPMPGLPEGWRPPVPNAPIVEASVVLSELAEYGRFNSAEKRSFLTGLTGKYILLYGPGKQAPGSPPAFLHAEAIEDYISKGFTVLPNYGDAAPDVPGPSTIPVGDQGAFERGFAAGVAQVRHGGDQGERVDRSALEAHSTDPASLTPTEAGIRVSAADPPGSGSVAEQAKAAGDKPTDADGNRLTKAQTAAVEQREPNDPGDHRQDSGVPSTGIKPSSKPEPSQADTGKKG